MPILYHVIAQLWKAHSGSYRASDFKSDERVARDRFEITSTNTPELYDTRSYYQLILSKTKWGKHNLRKTYLNKSHGPFNFVHVCFQSAAVNPLA